MVRKKRVQRLENSRYGFRDGSTFRIVIITILIIQYTVE